ncbi:MAG: CAP domain-containing protein, partial [Armatimonadota bacterium]
TRGLRTSEDRYFREYSGWYRHLGENIARREGPGLALTQENIVHTHKGLMRSPRHARNILGRDWEIVGVGIATDGGGKYWITEMFLAPWRRSDGRQPPLPRNRKKPTRE